MPTQDTLVLERFFDESGGMQLVLHAPFGSRINKAWGLALRKRFCRQFNFELQAAATEDALLLSLGPQHSFPLADVFRYLHPETARDVLVQAFLDAPVFQDALALEHDDLAGGSAGAGRTASRAAAAAHAGRRSDGRGLSRRGRLPREHSRRSPDSRSSARRTRRCATASKRRWTSTACAAVLERIHRGDLRLVARDTPEPSVLRARDPQRQAVRVPGRCAARGAADAGGADAPGERSRRTSRISGALDAAAIERVRDEARPDPRDADELHDALLTAGFSTASRARPYDRRGWPTTDRTLERAACVRAQSPDPVTGPRHRLVVAAERLPESLAVHPHGPRSRHRRDRAAVRPRVDACWPSSRSCAAG